MNGWWWLVAAGAGLLLIYQLATYRPDAKIAEALIAKRANPTRAQFVDWLGVDHGPEVAAFLWEELSPEWAYWHAGLTPHPDDDFLKDLPIDDEEPQDWLEHYCARRGFDWKDWPEWHADQPTTVRNFAKWLSGGPRLRGTGAA